jgi:uncharacterized phage protein (TIGR02218 family)
MRELPAGLAAHLAAGATTLARCWRVRRRDGAVLGFTDHDRPLVFDGTTFEPHAGFVASEIPSSLGLAVDTAEVGGALVSPLLREEDIRAGHYDSAEVEIFLINWSAPQERLLLEVFAIGEIAREGSAFKAELRSLSHMLDQERGRIYAATCDAELGDERCRVDMSAEARRAVGHVVSVVGPRTLAIAGAEHIAVGHLTRGALRWTDGANSGQVIEIRDDRAVGTDRAVELWEAPAVAPEPGDAFLVTVGCDKRFATCRDRFANTVNFRGFPHMPGNDFAVSYARRGERNDGSALA